MFRESKIAHQWIDPIEAAGGKGAEFGPAAHNPFGFKNCIFVDRQIPELGSPYYDEQIRLAGRVQRIDLIADFGTDLPFQRHSLDYLVTSHVLEHVWDLIECFNQMRRILRPYGVMVHVLPHVDRTFDKGRPLTTWQELCHRHTEGGSKYSNRADLHHSVFNTASFLEIITCFPFLSILEVLDVDDKVGNGFLVVLQVQPDRDGPYEIRPESPADQLKEVVERTIRTRSIARDGQRVQGTGQTERLNRNMLCPCGSGKRFKHCHGAT